LTTEKRDLRSPLLKKLFDDMTPEERTRTDAQKAEFSRWHEKLLADLEAAQTGKAPPSRRERRR
jgi:hypothetical protein